MSKVDASLEATVQRLEAHLDSGFLTNVLVIYKIIMFCHDIHINFIVLEFYSKIEIGFRILINGIQCYYWNS